MRNTEVVVYWDDLTDAYVDEVDRRYDRVDETFEAIGILNKFDARLRNEHSLELVVWINQDSIYFRIDHYHEEEI